MKLFAGALCGALLTVAGESSAAVNLLQNGSFESGSFLPGWTVTQAVGDTPPAQSVTPYGANFFGEDVEANPSGSLSPDSAGGYGVYFVSDNATETLSQVITAPTSGVYSIGFSAYVPQNGFDNPGLATFTGSIAGVDLVSTEVHSLTPKTWYNFATSTFLTAGTPVTAAFTFHTNAVPSADIVVDQVFVIAGGVPEPASWAMMLGGFGLAGSALRRRRALAV